MLNLEDYKRNTVKCLNPQMIYNKHLNESIVVPCRKCVICINNKSSLRASQCQQEQSSHKYCFFVTLTYDNHHIPKAQIVKSDNNTIHLKNITPRINNDVMLTLKRNYAYNVALLSQKQTLTFNNHLNKHLNLNKNVILYASKEDLQKYIKRVRYHIDKQTGEKIRYYAVSEYGPKTFRPHFHILFYFDSSETLKIFKRVTDKSWKYGNIKSELSQSSCGNYVSSYVNSSLSLPFILKTKYFTPFCTHSRFFGLLPLQHFVDEIYTTESDPLTKVNFSFPFGLVNILPTTQIKDYFFPKVYSYSQLNIIELRQLYRIYFKLSNLYYRLNDCCHENITDLFPCMNTSNMINEFKLLNLSQGWENVDILRNRLYNCILTSRHFIQFICHNNIDLFNIRLDRLIKFYNDTSLQQLTSFYQSQIDYSNSFPSDDLDYSIFYPDVTDENFPIWKKKVKSHPIYKSCEYAHNIHSQDKIKHKALNDLNGLLIAIINNI